MSLLDLFISNAYAADPAVMQHVAQPSQIPFFVMLGFFVLFLYFAIWRPQNKRAKEHRNLLNSVTKGDEILTVGGIVAKVVKMTDNFVVVNTGGETELVIQKSSIASTLPKGTLKSL